VSPRPLAARTFASLANPNYRRYFSGQAISLVGTWMQTVAQSWLVLTLTGSGTALGLIVALQFLPVLLLAPYGGVIADRVPKRRLLLATQSALALLALTLGLLTLFHAVRLWEVAAVALGLGLVNAFDNPARQAFVLEMVGTERLRNAVSLNSVLVNAARAVGPAVAGVLIATVGVGICFMVNAVSYVAVLASLATLEVARLHAGRPVIRARGQLRAGLRYVRSTPALAVPLIMMGVIGMLAYEFQVVLPVVARQTFHGGPGAYGLMTAAMGVGAVAGGLVVAGHARTGVRPLVLAAGAFGVVILAAAAAPTLGLEIAALVLVGAASVSFLAVGNTTLQLASAPEMRGRVMALWAVAFLGSTPLGGPIAGLVAEHAGPRWGLVLGGVAALTAAGVGALLLARGGGSMRRHGREPGLLVAPEPAEGSELPVALAEPVLTGSGSPRRVRSVPEAPGASGAAACSGAAAAPRAGSRPGSAPHRPSRRSTAARS
jgi:MFS family permease